MFAKQLSGNAGIESILSLSPKKGTQLTLSEFAVGLSHFFSAPTMKVSHFYFSSGSWEY